MAAVSTCYISAACNRTVQCVHWGRNGLVAYGSCRSIAIYEAKREKEAGSIVYMVNGHKGRVNCVKWISCPTSHGVKETEMVSGSTDNTAIVWKWNEQQYKSSHILKGHTSALTSIDAIYLPSDEDKKVEIPQTLIATASVDSTVKIWQREEGGADFLMTQTINFGSGFALDVALHILPGTKVPILSLGRDDCKIHLYVYQDDQFTEVLSLHGHEDWVRGIEFAVDDCSDLLLASCSQDTFIRIWRISISIKSSQPLVFNPDTEIKLKENTFIGTEKGKEYCYAVSLESVLAGHEHWVYGVHWKPTILENGKVHQPMCILSASMDKTMMLWKQDEDSGVWLDQLRVGEVGGNTLGLYGCQFSHDGSAILGHGYQGAFHLWQCVQQKDSKDVRWFPGVTVSGHFGPVQDIAWDPQGGEYLMSCSLDQTTRLHGAWKRQGYKTSWHEIARPQVHGYDMQCIAMMSRYRMVSGADEKVVRIFSAPKNFIDNFGKICEVDVTKDLQNTADESVPEGASVPALGLSNKAVYDGDLVQPVNEIHPNEQYPELYFHSLNMTEPPTEEHLLQNSLWPEIQKLYGHGYEIFSIAAHPHGHVLASACKAAKPEHAAIILWDARTWRQMVSLMAHSLTVTQLAFSHNGKYLLAVSRDRTWSLFRERTTDQSEADPLYQIIAYTDKKTSIHSRIIWSCSWSHDDKYFATASRDKKVIVWGEKENDGSNPASSCLGNYKPCSSPLDVGEAATAIDFAPITVQIDRYLLGVGCESGAIMLYTWKPTESSQWIKCCVLDAIMSHTLTVKRLKWRPIQSDDNLQLASCSTDCSVRIFNVDMNKL